LKEGFLKFNQMKLQITCINKSDRQNAHERIRNVGGVHNGSRWKKTQEQTIADIENNTNQFYVQVSGYGEVNVIVAKSAWGNKYIKTERDGEQPNNLLSLAECPS
jgi:hypothetical protein